MLFHSRGLELEQTGGLPAGEYAVSLLVVQRHRIYVYLLAVHLLDVQQRILYYRKSAQAQKVHFNKADALDQLAFVLDHALVHLAL